METGNIIFIFFFFFHSKFFFFDSMLLDYSGAQWLGISGSDFGR